MNATAHPRHSLALALAREAQASMRVSDYLAQSTMDALDAAATSQAVAGAAIAQAGREAGTAAVGVAQVTQAHGAAAGAAQANAAAHDAAAIAAQVAGNASMDASAKWVQLGVRLGEVAVAQEQQAKNAEKLAAAAKIEGDSLQALAALRGNDLEILQAASEAAQANAAALEKVAAAREVQLATLTAELATKRALIANNAEEQKARAAELQEIQKKIDALSAEATATRSAAEASKTDAAARRAAVDAYQDNAAAVGALRLALEQARIVQEAFESDRRRGLATDQQVDDAKRRVAEAQRLYNDALNDAVAAEQRKAAAKVSALQLERVGLFHAKAKLAAYKNNYGNVVRSQESLNEQHGVQQTVERLEQKLRERQAELGRKPAPRPIDDRDDPPPRSRGDDGTRSGGAGVATGRNASGSITSVVNMYVGIDRRAFAIPTNEAGAKNLEGLAQELARQLAVGKSVAGGF